MNKTMRQLLPCAVLAATIAGVAATGWKARAERGADVFKTLLKGMEHRAESIRSAKLCELRERYSQPIGKGPLRKHVEVGRWEFEGPLFRNEEWLLTPVGANQRKITYQVTSFDGEQHYEFEASDEWEKSSGSVTTSIAHQAIGPMALDLWTTRKNLEGAAPTIVGRETVLGHDCYHLTDTGPDGTQAHWWIAPQLSFLYVKLLVTRIPYSSPELEGRSAHKENLWRGVRFEKIDGFWVRTVTRFDKKMVFDDGRQQDLVCGVNELRNVSLNVSPTRSAFRYEFPLGTVVGVEMGETYRVGGAIEKARKRLAMTSLAEVERSIDREFPVEALAR